MPRIRRLALQTSLASNCHMIKSFHLVLKSTPTDRLVDESSFRGIYKYRFPHFIAHVIWVSKSKHVDKFCLVLIKSCVQINLEVSCSLHSKSWWQLLVQRTASQGTLASKDLCLYEHCFFHQRRENTTGLQSLQLCWTLDIQESLQVVSFFVMGIF